jgi:uncharacterized membrane protein
VGWLKSHASICTHRPRAPTPPRGSESRSCARPVEATTRPRPVFCGNPACHKALGDFKYVLEELRAEARWHHVVANKVTALIAKPQFVAAHFIWFALWIALNTGFFAMVRIFDEYPFFGLVPILAVETIFITIFVLISNNRQTAHADKRAALDYEVNVLTYREIPKLSAAMHDVIGRLARLEAAVREHGHGEWR